MQLEKTTGSLNYLLHLPQNPDSRDRWPMILFLHGVGERGDDLSLLKLYGLAKKVEQEPDFPFIVVSPQCAADKRWTDYVGELLELADTVETNYPVDRQRVYLSGLSMGGRERGIWLCSILTVLRRLPPSVGAGPLKKTF